MAQPTTISQFDPPAFLDDGLTDSQKGQWSNFISGSTDNQIAGQGSSQTPLKQFFNPSKTAFNQSQAPVEVTWVGFPGIIKRFVDSDGKRWKIADEHRVEGDIPSPDGGSIPIGQDEYLEWSVHRDPETNKIVSVTFTCEGPEYWRFLSSVDPDKVLALYREYNPEFADQIQKADLFRNGRYNHLNKWNNRSNTGSIMHLVQPNNTLGAEIDIAGGGTVIRKGPNGQIVTDPVRLCNCSQYGVATRNSDPKIGSSVNGLARQGVSVALANPVAIYIKSFDVGSFNLDYSGAGDLQPVPPGTFNFTRGDIEKRMALRLTVKVPDGTLGTGELAGKQLTVGDIWDTQTNRFIAYGAQFADYINMGVNAIGITGGMRVLVRKPPQGLGRHLSLSATFTPCKVGP
ncbi:hypothetical protein B0J13DRAFT_586228 [Dactylonectria estremocensis]|uniref:Uncharacterized protein n=1 Tax=Dactylonectria estremocensis TaxID=1079267 RepID=A0A9P9J2E9_9HYPO|nr:hypothetical protein B0J13DRAFT_586228 [Dactylonectria estremocensis]